MHFVSTWLFVTVLLLVVSIVTAVGAIRRRSVSRFIGAVALFVLFLVSAAVTVLKAGWKVLNTVREVAIDTRNGNDVYVSIWGKPVGGCLQVLDYNVVSGSGNDDSLQLHFRTCPEEVRRILHGEIADKSNVPASEWPGLRKSDGGNIMKVVVSNGNGRRLFYISADSTEVYYSDVDE